MLISVIIPFYNRVNTLRTCVESVLRADYRNTEIILVDDGSSDGSAEIADEFASKNSNVHVIHQQNGGVSAARNRGIDEARGEWITFVDSDDVVLPNHFDIVKYEGCDAELLMVGSGKRKPDNLVGVSGVNGKRIRSESAREYLMGPQFNPFKNIFYSIWDKFFKLDIINTYHIRFDESMSLGEDQVFVCDYLMHAGTMVHTTVPTYICVEWDTPVEHLGRKMRSPEDYLYNQIKGYEALRSLSMELKNRTAGKYAADFGINRPITKIVYGFAKECNRDLMEKGALLNFIETKVIPFLRTIDCKKYNAVNFDVRFTRYLLLKRGADTAYKWADLWVNHLQPVYNRMQSIFMMPKNFISYRMSKFFH